MLPPVPCEHRHEYTVDEYGGGQFVVADTMFQTHLETCPGGFVSLEVAGVL